MKELTKEERSAVNSLRRLINRWPKSLWLHLHAGQTLRVFKKGTNGEKVLDSPDTQDQLLGRDGAPDMDYEIENFDWDIDAGDW